MRFIPWSGSIALWDERFQQLLASCPAPERGQREWTAFLRSDLAARLAIPGTLIHTEAPFHAALKDGSILDGVMDLIALSPTRDRWLLADWKAEEEDHASEVLLRKYAGQLEAYEQALGGITLLPVDVCLYSTAAGAVPYPSRAVA